MPTVETIKRVWRYLREILSRPEPQPSQPPSGKPTTPKPTQQPDEHRYDVQNTGGRSVAKADSLTEAHRQWQRKTGGDGRIIDTQTGRDVTPPKDDASRYVVLDENDQQVSSHASRSDALEAWKSDTGQRGRVIDLLTKQDITPKRDDQYMDVGQLQLLLEHVGHSRGDPGFTQLQIDAELVQKLIRLINGLKLPVFDISNLAGKKKVPTKKVPIKRQRVVIEKKRRKVRVEVQGPRRPLERVIVPYATDDMEPGRIREPGDIRDVPPSQLGIPSALLRQRIATRGLFRPTYTEPVEDGPPTIRTRLVWEEYEEPVVKTWTETVEVAETPQAQVLELVVDVSGSMYGTKMNLAVALGCTVMGRHRSDGSVYMYRPFGDVPGDLTVADTPAKIDRLITFLVKQSSHELGGGTDILAAIRKAAQDVRRQAGHNDTPQILVVSDGDDSFTAADVYDVVGRDVILHTVVVEGSNYDLKQHSSTYCELCWDGHRVHLTRGDEMPSYDSRW